MPNNLFSCEEFISRDQILTCLYKSDELRKSINIVVGECPTCKELKEELRSELFLSLCELGEDQLKQMHENGYLDYYIVRTLRNMFDSKTSRFYKKIKKPILTRIELTGYYAAIPDEIEDHTREDKMMIALDGLNWFEREVLDKFVKHGSIAGICSETGVSVTYATGVLAQARKKIKNAVR